MSGSDGGDGIVSATIGGIENLKGGISILNGEGGDDSFLCAQGANTTVDGGSGEDSVVGDCTKITGVP